MTAVSGALAAPGDGVLDTTLVSRAPGTSGAVGDGGSIQPSISADGRFVAFSSVAGNLDPDSNDAVNDIFVRDTQTGATTLVSRAAGAAGAVGDSDSAGPSISADGRFVAFQSDAGNLDPDSNDIVTDVFVRDTEAATTTLMSRAAGATGAVGGGSSSEPSISADGRFTAFRSFADNLDSDSEDTSVNIFVRDAQTLATTLVNRADGAAGAVGDGISSGPSIAANGRFVAFDSDATNLDPDSNDAVTDVFVRDTEAATTTLMSRAPGAAGVVGDAGSNNPSISADGRRVAFDSFAGNLDSDSSDTFNDNFVRDSQTSATTLVSRAGGAAGAAGNQNSSGGHSISADGRIVAFSSNASNLDPADSSGGADVFVRELSDPLVTNPAPVTPVTTAPKKCKKGKKLRKGKCVKKKRKKRKKR